MNKPLFVVSAPVDTYSGYGARSRDVVKALIKSNKYEVLIVPTRWGNCPFGFLKQDNPEHKQIIDRLFFGTQLSRQPDVWMQITVPNEMMKVGKYNILVTAGIETDVCSIPWIEGLNRADLVLVSSEHAKKVLQYSKIEKKDQQTNQITETYQCKTKVEVLFEGADVNIYKKLDSVKLDLSHISEEFCFLFVGHWLQGVLGEDRKDVGMLIKTFLETFKNKPKKPALILKTGGATASILDKQEVQQKINSLQRDIKGDLPNIYLVHGELTDEEMNELYNHPKVRSFVTFTKGEGYGRPILEASIAQKPIIASNWSGHTDFLSPEFSVLLPGVLKNIHPSAVVQDMLIPEGKWFTVDYKVASKTLEEVYKNNKSFLEKAKRQSYRSRTQFSLEKMEELLNVLLDANVPKQKELVLPQVTLPKLKKVGE